ncbi:hypothetical protein BCT91_19150 [Vibrio cyclitrophicus]|uniref:LicD family protein n=1 Tax=Vibrio cyclitrophicus TaxID=47951 RepID=UPI000C832E58|nr:LicD family protein [Vibrio cyclitrophicus]PMK81660.1 hypothetical protein BCT91_19150 [Vibrio cyclitrophicus]
MNSKLTLREIQESSLDILKKVDIVCKENNLDYFVMYGTLIGAVRHNGFIPWDDDLDIMMPRKDYNKLVSYFKDHTIDDLELLNYSNCDEYPYMISRISDNRYKIVVENEKDYGIGTFIDVYPLDSFSDSYFLAIIKGRFFGWLSSLYFLSTRVAFHRGMVGNSLKSIVKLGAFKFSKFIGNERLKKILLAKNYEDKEYLACRQWMTNDYKRNIFKKSLLEGRTTLKFEGIDVPVPLNYHELLTDYYGDYMKYPPKELQIPHHMYKAYRVNNND